MTTRPRSGIIKATANLTNRARCANSSFHANHMTIASSFDVGRFRPKTQTASDEVSPKQIGSARRIAAISISAALYAAAIGVTSPISTPWGVGQFRPGVVFPALFSVIYGPLIGGIGAAIGTFVGDVIFLTPLGLTTPLLSVIAGVPGNFVGFFLLGWFKRKYRSWFGFVFGSFVSLLIGNLIAALGVVSYLVLFLGWAAFPIDTLVGAVFGFTFFWLVTMMPFVIPLVPPIVITLRPLVGGQVDVGVAGWKRGTGLEALRSSLQVSAIMGVLYVLVQFTSLGDFLFKSVAGPQFVPWLKLLFLISALVVFAFGVIAGLVLRHEN